jgi:hypothetical protein
MWPKLGAARGLTERIPAQKTAWVDQLFDEVSPEAVAIAKKAGSKSLSSWCCVGLSLSELFEANG